MTIEFGIGVGQDQSVHNVADFTATAEGLGYHHATMVDMNNLAQEVTVMMTLAAAGTDRIRIGHGVTNPATIHPGVIANATATLRELSNDRAFVGIGAGGPYGQFLKHGVRMERLRQSIKFIKDYSAGEEAELEGITWHSEWIRRSKYAGTPVPVWVAVAGPKTCQLAGEMGDAVLSIGMDPELQTWRKEQVQRGAEAAGRDPVQVDIWVRTQIYIAESKAAAKRELEPYAATCVWELFQVLKRDNAEILDLRARIERRHPGILDEFKEIFDHWDPYWTERIGGPQTEYVTQRVIDFFLASGSADEIGEQIEALEPLGVKGLSMVVFSIQDDLENLERVSKALMPRFR